VSNTGLSQAEAARRLARVGPNVLPGAVSRTPARIALRAIREPMLLLLVAAGGIYVALGDARDAALLLGSILLVVALAVVQEYRAERALQALREQGSPRAHVMREGAIATIPASDVVVGDRLLVEAGDRLAADARIVDASELEVDESLLTGESLPVAKGSDAAEPEHRLLRAGTLVVHGRATAVVTAVAGQTELGKIGAALRDVRAPPTPLQRQMRALVRLFASLSFAACIIVAVALRWRGADWLDAALSGVTLAIATIPEEFPVVVTVFLALGAWRMSKHAALVRQRAAIEALGSVTVLCTDKTGTLTENRMRVAEAEDACEAEALAIASLASPPHSQDPMDIALRAASPDDAKDLDLLREYPFSAARRSVAIAWRTPGGETRIACKGAPEAVVAVCGLPPAEAAAIEHRVARMASRGLRVLGVAEASASAPPADVDAVRFAWRGLVAFADPLRAGVHDAVSQARKAGIRVVMLTGDHAGTAQAIAREAGLARTDLALPGDVLDGDVASAIDALAHTDVFARVRPHHKLRLIEVLQQQGEVVAMTGDGINDAPALAAAHVGVAMGARGTDVARESAAIVLVDDDFTTLVRAIAEGRRIYANIRRAVRYILAVHVPITCLALLPVFLPVPPVLAPIHIVLLQLIIDPVCSIVFESDAADDDSMRRPPRPQSQRLVSMHRLATSLLHGLVMFLPVAAADYAARAAGLPLTEVRALDFTALVAGNVALIVLYRPGKTVAQVLLARNLPFVIAAIAIFTMLAIGTRTEVVGHWLDFAPPPLPAWCAALLVPLLIAAALKGLLPHAGGKARTLHPR